MDNHKRRMYQLHSRLPAFQRKVARTLDRIQEALATCEPWAISYSGGKDSTVLLDIIMSMGYRPIIVWQNYGPIETLPGNVRMVEWVREHYRTKVYEHVAPGEINVFRRVGHFFLDPTTKEEKDAVNWWWKQSFGALDRFIKSLGAEGHFWGLRAEESLGRRRMVGNYGHLHKVKKHGLWVSSPIYDWTGRDIWAYIVSRGLKWNDIYDHPQFDREKSRNDLVFLAGEWAITHGSFKFWQTYDPAWWKKVEEACPEIRWYV